MLRMHPLYILSSTQLVQFIYHCIERCCCRLVYLLVVADYAFEHALQHQDLILLLLRRRVGCSCGLLRIGFTSTLTLVDLTG